MRGQNLIRVIAAAVALSTLSFAAGVAGDLSVIDPPRSGESVVLRLPPEIPADAIRAHPLPPLLSTASAEAATPRRALRVRVDMVEPASKPRRDLVHAGPKPDPDRAPKHEEHAPEPDEGKAA